MFVYLNRIKYTICGHASTRMRKRGVRKTDIQACLDDPDVKFTPVSGYSLYMADHPNGKRLQVTINTLDKEVVSVVWLE